MNTRNETTVLLFALVITVAHASESPLTTSVMFYKNETLVAASALTAVLGAYLAAYWKPPTDLAAMVSMNSTLNKFLLGLAGGITAFFYILHLDNRLTVLHPAWVMCVAMITPVAVQIAFPMLVDVVYSVISKFFGKKEQ